MESADCAAVVNRRALGGRPSQARVPVPLTSFLARDQEIREVSALLRREDVRLLTLTGPGGVGKTRLAIAIAHTIATVFPDGVAFVGLAPIREASVVGSALAHAVIVAEASARSVAMSVTLCVPAAGVTSAVTRAVIAS